VEICFRVACCLSLARAATSSLAQIGEQTKQISHPHFPGGSNYAPEIKGGNALNFEMVERSPQKWGIVRLGSTDPNMVSSTSAQH